MHSWCTVNVGHIFDPWGPLQLYKYTIAVHHEQAIEWAWVQTSSSTYITHDFDCYTTKQVSELDMNIQLDLHHSAVSGSHLLVLQSVNDRLPYSSSIAQHFWSEERLTIGFHKQGYCSKNVRYCRLSLRSDPMLFQNNAPVCLRTRFSTCMHIHPSWCIDLHFLKELSDFVVPCHNYCQRWTGYQNARIRYCCCNNITRCIALHTKHVKKQLCQSLVITWGSGKVVKFG